jgi:lipid-A-disaccharide synthase-like uncharacterized protein
LGNLFWKWEWRWHISKVPHGSILQPLFFIVFINDIVIDIQSTIKLFADDTSLYLIITVLRNIQSEMFVIRNLSYRSVIHKNVRMMRFVNCSWKRKQRVVINCVSSDWGFIKAGVPHGSILQPLFFIVFINDIVIDIQSTIKLFADDTSLYLIIDNREYSPSKYSVRDVCD